MAQSIPMHQQHHSTRLGGRAHPHADDNVEKEYDRLRDLARAEASKRSSCFDRAHEAYERGDGAEAKHLSNEGKAHAAKMDEYNKQASEYIFRENNAMDRVAEDTIDLHGQFVEEAEDILEARIRDAQARGQTHLHVIVGKGNHSVNHVQKIKPRVERVCQELGLQYKTEENEGRMYVNLAGQKVDHMPPLPSRRSGDGGAGFGASQPSQAKPPTSRPQQQQQQQEQQGDDSEDMQKKILSKIVSKLGDCCVVM
ncbi:smr family protein [Coniella lustricola]|uniref:Smr family protein n=1 Tax=Coniella lustricola TaxID=2025994 RepID=A0A2T3AEL2_9PEZI|nr:smr family protein [Coniella lustricola]